jgi:hypothetical protein
LIFRSPPAWSSSTNNWSLLLHILKIVFDLSKCVNKCLEGIMLAIRNSITWFLEGILFLWVFFVPFVSFAQERRDFTFTFTTTFTSYLIFCTRCEPSLEGAVRSHHLCDDSFTWLFFKALFSCRSYLYMK